MLVEGLLVPSSRDDWTPIELFIATIKEQPIVSNNPARTVIGEGEIARFRLKQLNCSFPQHATTEASIAAIVRPSQAPGPAYHSDDQAERLPARVTDRHLYAKLALELPSRQ